MLKAGQFVIIMLTLLFSRCVSVSDRLVCNYTVKPVIIDANLDEWDRAKTITFKDRSGGSENVVSVKSLWDSQNLYLAFVVKDKNLLAKQQEIDHEELALDDIVEFLIDSKNTKDSCWSGDDFVYHINLFGQKKDDRGNSACESDWRWNGDAVYAVLLNGTLNDTTDIDEGYVVEISIPWTEVGVVPVAGLKIGVNFACDDRNGNQSTFFDWMRANPFRSPYAFGDIVLKK